jgi:hypothetical protein
MPSADDSSAAPPRPEFLSLGELYAREIQPWLEGQEGRRRQAWRLCWTIAVVGFAGLAILLYVAISGAWSPVWYFAVACAGIAIVSIANLPLARLAADAKKEVMGRLAAHFGFVYDPKPAAPDIELFDDLGLLPYRNNVAFEDGLSGEIKGVPFRMVEAHLTKRVKRGKSTRNVIRFRGLLLSFPSGRPAARGAICSRDADAELDGEGLQDVDLGDSAFDADYRVMAADAAAARGLLDGRARDAVRRLGEREDVSDLRLGFVDGNLLIAVNRDSNSFEVTGLGRKLADPSRVQAMVEQFGILFDIVDAFELKPGAAAES